MLSTSIWKSLILKWQAIAKKIRMDSRQATGANVLRAGLTENTTPRYDRNSSSCEHDRGGDWRKFFQHPIEKETKNIKMKWLIWFMWFFLFSNSLWTEEQHLYIYIRSKRTLSNVQLTYDSFRRKKRKPSNESHVPLGARNGMRNSVEILSH